MSDQREDDTFVPRRRRENGEETSSTDEEVNTTQFNTIMGVVSSTPFPPGSAHPDTCLQCRDHPNECPVHTLGHNSINRTQLATGNVNDNANNLAIGVDKNILIEPLGARSEPVDGAASLVVVQ